MTLKRILLLFGGAALAIVWIGAFTNIDMRLANAMYDRASGAFPSRHTWLAEQVSHTWMRNLLTFMAACAIAPAVLDWWRPRARWTEGFRLRLRVVALSAVLVPLAMTLLKRASTSHCPWDLRDFGGSESYVRLFEAAIAGAPAGHCMPAGHISSALWLVSLAVFWLPYRPRKAAAVAASALAFSFLLGWVQQLRGAHFLTHTLWSMWIACAIVGAVGVLVLDPGASGRARAMLRIKPRKQVGERAL
jgi:membrane-associated PAP2 superfamily phosphatase